jgi:hypothetical protein
MDAMAEAERVLLDDVAVLLKFEAAGLYVHSPRLTGIVRHAIGPDPDYSYARIEEPERGASARL